MKERIILATIALTCFAVAAAMAADEKTNGNIVTIRPDGGQAKVIQLEVINDNIIRVRATSKDELPVKPQSLMIVPQQSYQGDFTVKEVEARKSGPIIHPAYVYVKAKNVWARVTKENGRMRFSDGNDTPLIEGGYKFWDYTVPERELGGNVPEEQKHGLSWQMKFFSRADEAFYGLGQHQSEEFNMKGKNEDLFQYNTKVSIPFVLSNKNYGILWDAYSYCRFGNPHDYLQLNRAFKLYDKHGNPGHLTGTYTDRFGKTLVRDEDSLYYEYGTPAKSEIARKTDNGGIKNLPQGFSLAGANVIYEGFIEPIGNSQLSNDNSQLSNDNSQLSIINYQFILYYAGYIKVYIDGSEVVPERWRTAWNPNAYKFETELAQGIRHHLRIEWQPDGSESYCGLRVAEPRSAKERNALSIWCEMAKDMDYYFIAGQTSTRSSLAIAR